MDPLSPLDFYFAGPEVESPNKYCPGGYHPVHLGDLYCQRYKVIHKLGFGTYSTVWLARDLQSVSQTRYVALKFAVANLTGKKSEIAIHRHLQARSGEHPGSDRVLALLDHFKVQGANGEHDVLVLELIGPHLEAMFNDDPTPVQQTIRGLMHQVALGVSFLHHCGVVHADLHKCNIAFEVPALDGKPEENAMMALGVPQCVPVITRDHKHQMDSHPKYLVIPGSLVEYVKLDDMRVKIIDLGEAFFNNNERPQSLHTPLQVRAPEAIFNDFSPTLRVEYGPRIDVWSMGCLIYELATSSSLINTRRDETQVLYDLTTLLGPLPEEWVGAIGTQFSTNARDNSFEQNIQSLSELEESLELTALLLQILVIDPLRRPDVPEILDHPWFMGSPSPAAPSGSASE